MVVNTRLALPLEFWGEAAIEEATHNVLVQMENEGWGNNLHRNKGRWIAANIAGLFSQEGPFAK